MALRWWCLYQEYFFSFILHTGGKWTCIIYLYSQLGDLLELLVLSNQQSKTQRQSVNNEKHQIIKFEKLQLMNIWHICLKNASNSRLINPNSLWFIFCQRTSRLIFAVPVCSPHIFESSTAEKSAAAQNNADEKNVFSSVPFTFGMPKSSLKAIFSQNSIYGLKCSYSVFINIPIDSPRFDASVKFSSPFTWRAPTNTIIPLRNDNKAALPLPNIIQSTIIIHRTCSITGDY